MSSWYNVSKRSSCVSVIRCLGFFSLSAYGVPDLEDLLVVVLDCVLAPLQASCRTLGSRVSAVRDERVARAGGRMFLSFCKGK